MCLCVYVGFSTSLLNDRTNFVVVCECVKSLRARVCVIYNINNNKKTFKLNSYNLAPERLACTTAHAHAVCDSIAILCVFLGVL